MDLHRISRAILRLIAAIVFRMRIEGSENFPQTGGGLICANHQSYLDAVIVGISCDREMCYVARETFIPVDHLALVDDSGTTPFRFAVKGWDYPPSKRLLLTAQTR